ncbi:unnamed protein product [Pieris brassicae]|uniref:Uncharacterized protein n=1 Tax=Pieris brassicae TaxID=7116 RepID=A0A9P0TEU9_PIEBR|nr:unnamed protein product [Pieris brassicae]
MGGGGGRLNGGRRLCWHSSARAWEQAYPPRAPRPGAFLLSHFHCSRRRGRSPLSIKEPVLDSRHVRY